MIETIDVARVLREAIATPYRILVTRATGALVRDRIELRLAQSRCHAAVLDFRDVDLLDLSCADEVVAKLLRGGKAGFVAIAGLHEDLREQVHDVLEPQQLAVTVVHDDGASELLGAVPDDARAAFRALQEACCTCGDLARRLGWGEDRALAALEALATQRLARRGDHGYTLIPFA
jgi:anti-anti-sigma regulatory factor